MSKYILTNNIARSINQYVLEYFKLSSRIRTKFSYILKRNFRGYEYLYNLDKYKFEKTRLLPLLTRLLNKYIDKKIEYNIINLKSLIYSPDIFTDSLNFSIVGRNQARLSLTKFISNKLIDLPASILRLEQQKSILRIMGNFFKYKRSVFIKRYVNTSLMSLLDKSNLYSFLKYIFPSYSPSLEYLESVIKNPVSSPLTLYQRFGFGLTDKRSRSL